MSISTIRRQMKNVAFNFSEAQKKVREATSNDPWGPSTTLMSEIADLTHNPVSFIEIMSMIWKRLNDSGKNWRHVYKSLVLLEFVLKCGNEKVAHQARENIFTIETLKDFQHFEGDKDEGINIRKLSDTITKLLSDRENLKIERTKFMATRERYKKKNAKSVGAKKGRSVPDPQEATEAEADEDIQLQIALAMSREEIERANELRKGDEARLNMAMEQSEKEPILEPKGSESALVDLLCLESSQSSAQKVDYPWSSNPWPTQPVPSAFPAIGTHWDPFGVNTLVPAAPFVSTNPFEGFGHHVLTPSSLTTSTVSSSSSTVSNTNNNNNDSKSHKNAENFLGEHKHLVNLDMLLH